MAYVGTPIDTTNQFQSLQGKRFSGDGSTTAFTLDIAPTSVFDIEVFVENVRQDPNSAYSLSGTTLTFTGAPASGTNNIYVVHQAKAVGTINPTNDSVTTSAIVDNAVTTDKLQIANTNTSAGNVRINDKSGDQSAGNPQYTFSNNTGTGMRRAASNIIAFDTNSTEAMRIDAAGHVTKPLQSGFQAQNASEQSNLAINSFVTLTFATEISDTNADYDTSNSTFTAPVTGKYLVTASLQFNNLDHDATYWQTQIKTSNREYTKLDSGNQYDADPTNFGYYQTMVVDMDANDTCIIRWYQGGGTAQADMRTESFFAMQLLA